MGVSDAARLTPAELGVAEVDLGAHQPALLPVGKDHVAPGESRIGSAVANLGIDETPLIDDRKPGFIADGADEGRGDSRLWRQVDQCLPDLASGLGIAVHLVETLHVVGGLEER